MSTKVVAIQHSIWKDISRRMFRHRFVAQCARLGFGVSLPDITTAAKLASEDPKPIKNQRRVRKR